MGIYNKIRGGVNSNHRSGRMDYPYAGDGSPSPQMYTWGNKAPKNEARPYDGNDFANEVASAPKAGNAGNAPKPSTGGGATPTPSGRGKYQIKGGGYVRTTPTSGREDRQDVTYYDNNDTPQYEVSGASFQHDEKSGMVRFGDGVDRGSGKRMQHVWEKPSMGGNLHKDDMPY